MHFEDLVFIQITFEMCTLNLYFENGEVGIKKLGVLMSLKRFLMFTNFYAILFSKKSFFMKLN